MKKNGDRGFTLLEMIVVIFLITLMVGISAVVFTRVLPSQKVDAAARELIAAFRLARSTAIMSGKWQVLTIEIEGKSYGIEGTEVMRKIPESVSIKVIDPLSGEITEGGYQFVFAPSGVTEGGTIILSAGKKVIALEIDPIVGAVISKAREQ
jgi:prepilin-type N-terminal cleavage/methylation domain-containing protein